MSKYFFKSVGFLWLLVNFSMVVTSLSGQSIEGLRQVSEHVAIIGQSETEGVRLRWAPAGFSSWIIAAHKGWVLERAEWTDDNYPLNMERLSFEELARLKAYEKDEWEAQLNIRDTVVAIAAQALFGSSSNVDNLPSGMAGFKLKSEEQAVRHATAMQAADLSRDAAIGLGLTYFDDTVENGIDYVYRLRLEANNDGFGADTVYFHAPYRGEAQVIPEVVAVQAISKHGAILLQWPKDVNSKLFTAYHIERSINGKEFVRISRRPITAASGEDQGNAVHFVDSLAIGIKASYRVLGITPFAQWSSGETVVSATSRDMVGPMPPKTLEVKQFDNGFELTWDIDKALITDDCIGWKLKRSLTASSGYTEVHDGVLPIKQRNYIDEAAIPIVNNYYRVYAVDTAGNETPSIIRAAVWQDDTPPTPPVGVMAEADSNGIVHIMWADNQELDLMGYRVFVRDDGNKKWYQLTDQPIIENTFRDSVEMYSLSKSLEYSVVAIDFNYNASDYAEPFTVILPDLVPPSPPRWADWSIQKDTLHLKWHISAADDVIRQELLQRWPDGNWSKVSDLTAVTQEYIMTLTSDVPVDIALIAIDEAGNLSDTLFLNNLVTSYQSPLPPIMDVKLEPIAAENAIRIQWLYPEGEGHIIHIFRKDKVSDDLEEVGSFSEDVTSLIDRGPTKFSEGFFYYLRATNRSGRQSPLSGPFEVNIIND